jgi:hypothetical protein
MLAVGAERRETQWRVTKVFEPNGELPIAGAGTE